MTTADSVPLWDDFPPVL